MRVEHIRMCNHAGIRIIMYTGGNLKQINFGCDQLCNADPLINSIAIFSEFSAAHPKLDRKSRTHGFPYAVQNHKRKARAVFCTPAKTVGSMVHSR